MTKEYEELKERLDSTKKASVTDDMINRLETKLPKGAFGTPPPTGPGGNPFLLHERQKQMEEELKALKNKLEFTLKPVDQEGSGELRPVADVDSMEAAYASLRKIVEEFNEGLKIWHEKTGCVVEFAWKYDPCKQLDIAGIDVIVFRRGAPSSITIKEALENAPTEV